MTVTTLRPNGSSLVSGSVGLSGGATIHAVLSDNTTSTYVNMSPATTVVLDFNTLALPAGAVLRSITNFVTISPQGSGGDMMFYGAGSVSQVPLGFQNFTDSSTVSNGYSDTGGVAPSTQADIDNYRMTIVTTGSPTYGYYIYDAWINVLYAAVPTTPSVSAPAGTITINAPTATWTHRAGSDGGSQTNYQLKVYTQAQYTAGGFDPATAASPVYDTGVVASSVQTLAMPPLPNGVSYRVYVRTAQTTLGTIQWSPYGFAPFVVSVPPVGITSLVADAANTVGRVDLTATRTASPVWQTIEWQYSYNAGTTWTALPGYASVTAPAGTTATAVDYGMPNGAPAQYQARGTYVSNGLSIVGAWTVSNAVTWSGSAAETFNRANGALGANWLYDTASSAYAIDNNTALRGAIGNDYATYVPTLSGAQHYAEADVDVSAATGLAGIAVRVSGSSYGQNMYLGMIRSTNTATLAKVVNSVYTEFATVAYTHGPTLHLRLEIQNEQLSLYGDGVLITRTTDTSLPTGVSTGLMGQSGARFDNFNTGLLTNVNTSLVPAAASHVEGSSVPILGPIPLTVDSSSHVNTSTGVGLVMPVQLFVDPANHAHIVTNVTVALPGTLIIDDAKHVHVATTVTVYQPPYLVVNPAAHALTSANPILLGNTATMVVSPATHVLSSDRPALATNTPIPSRALQVHGIVCSYLGDGEYDIGKTANWLNNFVNTLFFYDMSYGDAARKYAVDYSKSFPDAKFAYHPATSKGYYEDAALFRKMAFDAASSVWDYQPGDWVVFIDASESLSSVQPHEQLLPDVEWPKLLTTLLEEARSATFPALTLPFFVFLQQGTVTENIMSADAALGNQLLVQIPLLRSMIATETDPDKRTVLQETLDHSLMLQAANESVTYWTCNPQYMTGARKLTRMFRVSYLRSQAPGSTAWKGIDQFAQATGTPATWCNVVAYGYARYGDGLPPWTVDTDGGFANRTLLQQVRTVGLPTNYATADPAGVAHPAGTQSPTYCYLYSVFDTGDGNPAFNQYVALWRLNPRDGVWYVNYALGPVPMDPMTGDPSVDPALWDSQPVSTTGPAGAGYK